MEAYLLVFVSYKQDDWAILLSMAKFTYNHTKNASTSHISFELNYYFHPQVFYKKDVNPHFQSKSINELIIKLRELMTICRENL